MTKPETDKALDKGLGKTDKKSGRDPQWTNSLKQLYDSVVHEPLPDSFKDLLSKLDDDGAK